MMHVRFGLEEERDYFAAESLGVRWRHQRSLPILLGSQPALVERAIGLLAGLLNEADELIGDLSSTEGVIPLVLAARAADEARRLSNHVVASLAEALLRRVNLSFDGRPRRGLRLLTPKFGLQLIPLLAAADDVEQLAVVGEWWPEDAVEALVSIQSELNEVENDIRNLWKGAATRPENVTMTWTTLAQEHDLDQLMPAWREILADAGIPPDSRLTSQAESAESEDGPCHIMPPWVLDVERRRVASALVSIGRTHAAPAIRGLLDLARVSDGMLRRDIIAALGATPRGEESGFVLCDGATAVLRAELIEFLAEAIAEDVPAMCCAAMLPLARLCWLDSDNAGLALTARLAPHCAQDLRQWNRAPIAAAALDALAIVAAENDGGVALQMVLDRIEDHLRSQIVLHELPQQPTVDDARSLLGYRNALDELHARRRAPMDASLRDRVRWLYETAWKHLLKCLRDEVFIASHLLPSQESADESSPLWRPYERRLLPQRIRLSTVPVVDYRVDLGALVRLAASDDYGDQRDASDAALELAAHYPLEALPVLAEHAAVDQWNQGRAFQQTLERLIREYPSVARDVFTLGIEADEKQGRTLLHWHPSAAVRAIVATVLDDFGATYPREALTLLTALKRDADEHVRRCAIRSQQKIRELHGKTLDA